MGFEYDFDTVEKTRQGAMVRIRSVRKEFSESDATRKQRNARSQVAESLRKAEAEHTYREQADGFDDLAANRERLRAVKANPPFYGL